MIKNKWIYIFFACFEVMFLSYPKSTHGQSGAILPVSEVQVSSTGEPIASWNKNGLIDGNINSAWSSTGHVNCEETEWVELILDNIYDLTQVTLIPRSPSGEGFPVNFKLQYATENQINSQTIWYDFPGLIFTHYVNPGNSSVALTIHSLDARAIRVLATTLGADNYNNCYLQFGEIQVFGKTASPFSTSLGGQFDADLNNMWKIYGAVSDGSNTVHGVNGWNTSDFFANVSPKFMWTSETMDHQVALRNKIRQYPMSIGNDSDRGYFWTWNVYDGWASNGGRHYSLNSGYIMGVYEYYLWTHDATIFTDVDQTTISKTDADRYFQNDLQIYHQAISLSFPDNIDVSQGKTVIEKMRMGMKALLEEHNGKNGLLIVNDPHAQGTAVDPNDTTKSKPTNYSDNYPDGYKSAYNNMYFYRALKAMVEIEKIPGIPSRGSYPDSDYYQILAEQVKQNFNSTFWHVYNKRYIHTIDSSGRGWDFGATYLNLEAIYSGLADGIKIQEIYEWLNGNRIINDDTSKGTDIYSLIWAPRWNTRSIESAPAANGHYWWWGIPEADSQGNPTGRFYCTVGINTPSVVSQPSCSWGEHQVNGGAIFYPSFFDIINRVRYLSSDNGWQRFNSILSEFHVDQLKRDPLNNVSAAWKWGIIEEFPESGLVPTAFLYGFLGISAQSDGLHVYSQLPSNLQFAKVTGVTHWGKQYEIAGQKGISQVQIQKTGNMSYRVVAPDGVDTNISKLLYSLSDIKALLSSYLLTIDNQYLPVDGKINVLDASYVMKSVIQ